VNEYYQLSVQGYNMIINSDDKDILDHVILLEIWLSH